MDRKNALKIISSMILPLVVGGCSTLSTQLPTIDNYFPPELNYTVRSTEGGAPAQVQINLKFQGSPHGETVLVLPRTAYLKDKVYSGLKNLKVLCSGCALKDTDSPVKKIIQHAPNELIQLEYGLEQVAGSIEPTIQPNYFYLNGSFFAHPDMGDHSANLKIAWLLPRGWKVANSFDSENFHQELDGVFNDNPINNINESAFVAGDFRIHKIIVHDHLIVFATRGQWKMDEKNFVEVVKKVIKGQREMWRDFDVPYYFVLLLPNGKPCCSRGGHGFTHSFVAYLSEDENNMERFTNVLAHEHFHYWNGEKLAPKAGSTEFWFTEGFTDYYARVLNYRSGVSSYKDFVDGFNSAIYRYYEDSARDADDVRLEKEFNSNSAITQLPYSKGDVVGSEWNLVIREKTQNRLSLDDFMRSLYEKSKTSADGLTKNLVRMVLVEMIGSESADRLLQMAISGALVTPSSNALGPCAYTKEEEMGRLEYGYDRYSDSRSVTKVKPGSAAEAAGLREGQEILEKHEEWFRPWKQIEFKVKDKKGIRWIRFLPQSQDKISFPRYLLNSKTNRRCRNF